MISVLPFYPFVLQLQLKLLLLSLLFRELSGLSELAVYMEPCEDSKRQYESPEENDILVNDRVPSFWREVWGSSKATCRALLLDHTTCGINTVHK